MILRSSFVTLFFAIGLSGCFHMKKLPTYVVVNNPQSDAAVLRTPAQPVAFPLSKKDSEIVRILTAKFDGEKNCAGLAAPQIGFNKRIIVFAVSDDPELKKWRTDLVDTMPKTVWINPSYEGIGEDKNTDLESCFSVDDLAGPVARHKTIRYSAFNTDGTLIEGVAHGFLARLIQHEIDHLNGRLFIDLVPEQKLFSIQEYLEKRKDKMGS